MTLLCGLALVACGDSNSNTSATSGPGAVMTDAEFCSAIRTDLPGPKSPSPTDVTTTTDPRAVFEHIRSVVDRAPTSIHGPMTVYFDAITKVFDMMYPPGDRPSTTMGRESPGEVSKVMAGQPVQDALKALDAYGTDTCKFNDTDNPFANAIKSSGADSTTQTDTSGSSGGSEAKLPAGFDATLQTHLISVGIGSETDKPAVEVSDFQRNIIVTVSGDVDAVAACRAASDFAFGAAAPSGAAELVTIEQGFDARIVAQRAPTDAECRTSGFVYHYISDYLHAEHADASWIGQISGGGYSNTGDGYEYSVSVQEGTPEGDALEICAAAAGYAFGPRVDPPATSVEIQASSASGGATATLAHATSADNCVAGPAE